MLGLFAFLCAVYVAGCSRKNRQEQLKRMNQYSLLTINPEMVDEDSRVLEFVAFDQHYVVELTRKREWTPSSVRHSNVDGEVHSPLSSMEESCHFSGRVLNEAADSVVSASLCEGRGLRARISAFGETLILKPSAYYLDVEADKVGNHSVNDEVLAYRLSDFEGPDSMVTEELLDRSNIAETDLWMAADEDSAGVRRRLFSSSTPAQTEVAVVIGPVRTANYKAEHGEDWYIELFRDTQDMMSSVDDIYSSTNWNLGTRNSVGGTGSLRIVMAELHVIYSFSGSHSALAPTKRFSNCPLADDAYDDSNECAIDGRQWLRQFQQWISNNMDTSEYDNVQMISDMMFNWNPCSYGTGACGRTLGWGSIGEVCRGSRSSAVNSVVDDMRGNDGAVGTIAHEMGHNFGLFHDGQPGPASFCCSECGLMGYGHNHVSFSGCSLDLMEEYFNGDGDGLQCLSVGWDGNTVTNVDSGESAVVVSPTASPVTAPSSSDSLDRQCLSVDMGLDHFDGTWAAIEGGHTGYEAYRFVNGQGATKFLYRKELTWSGNTASKWAISETLGASRFVNLICSEHSLSDCSSKWKYPRGATLTDSVTDYSCDGSGGGDNSCDHSYRTVCVIESGPLGGYDGYYDASGCHNGTRYYNGSRGNYLCYDHAHSQWTITWELCDRGNIISQSTTPEDGVLAPGYWSYSSRGSYYNIDRDMELYDCSYLRNGAFSHDDLRCLEDKAYGDEICVSSNGSLWNGDEHRTFTLNEELCSNEEPIYQFVEYNESRSLRLPSGEVVYGEVAATLYLHFELVYPTVTDNETVGQWWLSRDEMTEYGRIAFCEQEDLRECTSNQWNVEATTYGVDGTVFSVLDDFSSVLDGHCDSHFAEMDGSADLDDSGLSPELVIAILALSLLFVAMNFVAGLCVWRRLKYQQYQNDAVNVSQSVMETEEEHAVKEMSTADGDETAEISVSVDVDSIHL